MKSAPSPVNEINRLAALRRYRILDTESEKSFDDLTYVASFICQTPIALVSFVDKDRQWFKSRIGLDMSETSREVSFCGHAILRPETMIVPDTFEDSRFADNPLVREDPHIRFYAGAPLVTVDSLPLGTLCVIDRVPRTLTKEQQLALEALSRQASALIEMRGTLMDLNEALGTLKMLGGLLPICASCKKIRDEQGRWHILEAYIQDHSDAQFSHGVCPECAQRLYPDHFKRR